VTTAPLTVVEALTASVKTLPAILLIVVERSAPAAPAPATYNTLPGCPRIDRCHRQAMVPLVIDPVVELDQPSQHQ
jgi:hypothetical protein